MNQAITATTQGDEHAQGFLERRQLKRAAFGPGTLPPSLDGTSQWSAGNVELNSNERDQLGPARGLAMALASSVLVWALLAGVGFALF